MALTILERPEGHIINSSIFGDAIASDGGGYVVFTDPGHGLTDGDVIYMDSPIENYNGFWVVDSLNASDFRLVNPLGGYVEFINITAEECRYYTTSFPHGWSAVHLPITYRISNDLYPTNSADTTRNINSVQESNGYSVLQLSGSLGTINTYDFIKITVPNDTDLSGVYQVLEYISDTVLIINLLYDSGNNFTSATAIKHYNNYNVLVRIYAGINSSHEWAAQKPYELAATKEFIPDEDNRVFFSINDILQSYVETRNNLLLGTLPNNIDFWGNFYIEIAEIYDDSDGYSFGSSTPSYTSDQSNFEGVFVNAKLEFKNVYSGYLSDYLMTNNTAKFLTLFTIPVLFQCGDDTPNCYQDISFLNPYDDVNLIFREQYYNDGNAGTLNDSDLGTSDKGLIRASLSQANCDYDRVDVSVLINTELFTDGVARFTSGQTVQDFPVFIAIGQSVNTIFKYSTDATIISGVTAGDEVSWIIHYVHDDESLTLVDNNSRTTVGSTTSTNVSFPIPTKNVVAVRVTLTFTDVAPTGLDASVSVVMVLSEDLEYNASETKQFRIDCGCSNQEIRLTWLNNIGGFDYWSFTAKADHIREIQESITTTKNIFPQWPKSYGSDADTIKKQSKRVSNKAYTIRSQFLTSNEADALSYIKSSVLVQIINSKNDRRTIIVDTDSFIVRKDAQDTFELAFNVSFTDDISVQSI